MKRVMRGGLLGGLVLFAWSFIAHLPPVGTAGYALVPASQDETVLTALRGAMTERAVYVLPRLDTSHPPTAEEQRTWIARYEAGPAAVVAFDPHPGGRAFFGSLFAGQLMIELIAAILAALLGATIAANLLGAVKYWPRVFLVATIGLIATIDVDASYWSWYGFPTTYLLAQFADHGLGWFFAGLVLARVCRPAATA